MGKKRIKYLQKQELVRRNKLVIDKIAFSFNYNFHSYHSDSYRYSLTDELNKFRVDIYLSTLTIGIMSVNNGDNCKYYKRKDLAFIEGIMATPENYLKTGEIK